MLIKTIQWNIGGGKVRLAKADPFNDFSFNKNGFLSIKKCLKQYQPDIVFIQEAHKNKNFDQIGQLAKALGGYYFFQKKYASSHIEKGQNLNIGLLSRFPIIQAELVLFKQPKKMKIAYGDRKAWMHKKGVLDCTALINDKKVVLKSVHLFPFRRMGVDPLSSKMRNTISDISSKLNSKVDYLIIQGDFNFNDKSVKKLLPKIFVEKVFKEVILKNPTTPRGKLLDHVVYKGLKFKRQMVINDVLTDHFPVYTEFEV